ncbi:MAG: hypothetical protein H6883_07170 [Rhodobiaceae bacterium]|nr:hypothetical protein [Rhodobiaceae bacterium]MCC0055900.1 hypothetical protein [Rhodobiaceae bacterium]
MRAVDLDMLAGLVWYALLVPPRKERAAHDILQRQGIDTYLPIRKEWRRRNRYSKAKDLCEFAETPRYVFAGFNPSFVPWLFLDRLPIISGVVGIEGRPVRLRWEGRGGLEQMMRTYPSATYVAPSEQRYMHTHHEFTVGDEVEVIGGVLDGRRLKVVNIRESSAICQMLMLGGPQDVTLPLANLVKSA